MINARFAGVERNIARSRIVLSVVSILSVYTDPSAPKLTRWVAVSGGAFMIDTNALAIMGLHLLYALGVYWAVVVMWPAAERQIAAISTSVDVLFGGAVAIVTEGGTSPAYVFFAFAILAVGCRAGFRSTLKVTAACVAIYLGLIVISARGTTDAYIMRPAYLAITGFLIGYMAQQRIDFEARAYELESRAERQTIARSLHDGYVQALAGVNLRLETCRELLRRGRHEAAFAEITELQGGVRREYDDVRAYLRSLVNLERRETVSLDAAALDFAATRFTLRADVVGSGPLVEHVLQIMLEGVRNARRHAQASSAAISAGMVERRAHVTIDDDGVGFSDAGQPPWTIASRVAECGGDVRIVQGASGGAHLLIEIPEV